MFPSPTSSSAMPLLPIIMPQLGESIAEATIVSAAYSVGDRVEADADLLLGDGSGHGTGEKGSDSVVEVREPWGDLSAKRSQPMKKEPATASWEG